MIVVGGGLAALTAGLFAARHGWRTLVLAAGAPGGHLLNVERIEDFPGFPEGVPGYDLCPMVQEQAANAGADFALAEVERLEADDRDWIVVAGGESRRSRAVIVATGSRLRPLGVPGEERLRGRGVSHCATCDGPLFRGKRVGVVGGGDSALQEALTLAEHADEVLLFHRRDAFRAQRVYQERVEAQPKIQVRPGVQVEEVLGEDAVEAVRIRNLATGAEERVELAGLFAYVGLEPNTAFLRDVLSLAPDGRVPTDGLMRSERLGLFAAGDIRADSVAQAITAAGDGATAAVAAHRYLAELAES